MEAFGLASGKGHNLLFLLNFPILLHQKFIHQAMTFVDNCIYSYFADFSLKSSIERKNRLKKPPEMLWEKQC